MSSLEKELHLNKLPSRPPMPTGQQPGSKARMGPGRKRDFSPVPWNQYFETMKHIAIEHAEGTDSFRIYQIGSSGPVLLLLHGGGHSALSWAVFSLMITSRINCRIVAVDLRGHGDTDVIDDENLSAEAMSRDIGNIVQSLYGANPPPIMLVGHSMGGAIAVHIAASQLLPSLLALCVIDVVEGTAMDALNSMQTFLRSRPKSFTSVENAIEWSVKSGQIRNLESAKVSMAGQIKECKGTYFISPSVSSMSIAEPLEEEEEEEDEQGQVEATQQEEPQPSEKKQISVETTDCVYTWRIDLAKTEKYWDGWFRGLSNLFLSCPVPKLLLLAGVDRLDRELTIGQMQGKFQMQVLPQCGHAVHEDDPDKVAEAIATFLIRNKFTEAKGDI